MSGLVLTGRERVRRMFAREDHDRVPRHDSFWPDTIQRWQGEGLEGDEESVLRLLESDFAQLCWSWPAPFPGSREIQSEDPETEVIRDAWGATARFWKHRSGTPEHLGFECSTPEVWRRVFRPAYEATGLHVDPAAACLAGRTGRESGRWCFLAGVEGFEATRKLMGDEVTLMAMATDPDWVREVSRVHTDVVLRDFQAILDAGCEADGVWIYGDMAYNHATVCSPAMYRSIIWPDHQRMCQWAHERDMPVIFHTDGDVRGVLDLYVEAGFDCLQPLEAKASMDLRQLVPDWGDRLAFFGNIDVMVLGTNDREAVLQEVTTKLAAGKASRGYVYHTDHSVPPTVSWETYRHVIELLEEHGSYD